MFFGFARSLQQVNFHIDEKFIAIFLEWLAQDVSHFSKYLRLAFFERFRLRNLRASEIHLSYLSLPLSPITDKSSHKQAHDPTNIASVSDRAATSHDKSGT